MRQCILEKNSILTRNIYNIGLKILNWVEDSKLIFTFGYGMVGQCVHSHRYGKIIQIVQKLVEATKFLEHDTNIQFRSVHHSVQVFIIPVHTHTILLINLFYVIPTY